MDTKLEITLGTKLILCNNVTNVDFDLFYNHHLSYITMIYIQSQFSQIFYYIQNVLYPLLIT